MKKMIHYFLIIPLIGLVFLSCEKNNANNQSDRIFDLNDIELLEIENMSDFWGDANDIDTFYIETSSIYNDSSFIGGVRLSCENAGQYIEIYVFKSMDAALNDMNVRINTVACVIQEGTSDKIPGDWWFTECIPNSVFVSKWNTIIQVSYSAGNFESVQDILYGTVIEILERMDKINK
jgi:hypothetical protein